MYCVNTVYAGNDLDKQFRWYSVRSPEPVFANLYYHLEILNRFFFVYVKKVVTRVLLLFNGVTELYDDALHDRRCLRVSSLYIAVYCGIGRLKLLYCILYYLYIIIWRKDNGQCKNRTVISNLKIACYRI